MYLPYVLCQRVQVRGAGAGVLRRVPRQRDGAERERRLPRLSRQEPRGPARELPPGKYYIILFIFSKYFHPSQISWVRIRDWHILTNGLVRFSTDDRFNVLYKEGSFNWVLQVI